MAIIYTYPLKQKPVPADLVVITDSQDRNYTKQCSIQSIIDIIPGGGGGSCPVTYVIKPVECDGGDCRISTKLEEWVWTCDETLGALAPGYIDSLTLNGTSIPHPAGGTDNCWYIESVTLAASATTCDTCCGGPEEDTYSYKKCGEDGIYVTVDVDPGDVIGKAYGYCCTTGPDASFECWEYMGDIGRPVESAFTCSPSGSYDDCDCCLYRCHYKYTKCDGEGGAAFPAELVFDVGMDSVDCGCKSPETDIVVHDGAGYYWCYSSPEAVCLPSTEIYTITGTTDSGPCEDSVYCPGGEEERYRWVSCSEPFEEVIDSTNPLQDVGYTVRYCCSGEPSVESCYQYMGTTLDPLSGSFPACVLQGDWYTECNCCINHCNFEYTACAGKPEGFPESTVINMGLVDNNCYCETEYTSIVIEIEGVTWCYENPVSSCEVAGEHEVYIGNIPCGDPAFCPTPTIQYKWKLCDDEIYSYTDSDTDAFLLTIGTFPFVGTLQDAVNCETEMCCIEIEEFSHEEPITSISTACTVSSLTAYDDCDCCKNRNVAKYEVCAIGGAPCAGYGPYYIDTCTTWGVLIDDATVPDFIQVEVVAEQYCCFEKVPNETCEEATMELPPIVVDPSFIDCNCGGSVYRYKTCDGEVWTYTTQDLSAAVGSAISTGEDCYVIESTATLVGPDTPLATYDPAGFLFVDCECCQNPRIKYLLCAEQDVSCGTAGVTSVVIADVWGSLGAAPNNILLDVGESCCYEQDNYTCDPLTDPAPTFTSHVDCNCDA